MNAKNNRSTLTAYFSTLCFLIATLLALNTSVAFAQVKPLCDADTKCSMGQDAVVMDDLDVGGDVTMFNFSGGVGKGSGWTRKWVTTSTPTTLSGATTNCGGSTFIPAGATVDGCIVRVTTTITGATSFKIGDGSDDDKWGATIALTAGTTTTGANFTAAAGAPYAAGANLVITAVGGAASFSAGALRCACLVSTFTPFSS